MREPMANKRIVVTAIVGTIIGIVILAGAGIGGFFLFGKTLGDPAPSGPKYPVVFGVRTDGDHFTISAGRECPTETTFDVFFWVSGQEPTHIQTIDLVALQPVTILDLTDPEPQLRVESTNPKTNLTPWTDFDTIQISADFPSGTDPFFSVMTVSDLQNQSAKHPGQYYFGKKGWLTTDKVTSRDGIDLYTICTPWER